MTAAEAAGSGVPQARGLDDFEARPGTVTSLLRTFVGLHLRQLGGWIAVADLVRLLEEAGLTAASVRSAVSRAKSKGLLVAESRGGVSGYGLTRPVADMLERGDATIFSQRRHDAAEGWCLLSYSVPERQRSERYRLRRLLVELGCGTVADGLFVAPTHVGRRIDALLDEAGLRDWVTVFDAAQLSAREDLAAACRRWWDVEGIADQHRRFLDRFGGEDSEDPAAAGAGVGADPAAVGATPEGAGAQPVGVGADPAVVRMGPVYPGRDAFVVQLHVVDAWRPIPYRDPGLPLEALPADWPGDRSARQFADIVARVSEPAASHVRQATGTRRP